VISADKLSRFLHTHLIKWGNVKIVNTLKNAQDANKPFIKELIKLMYKKNNVSQQNPLQVQIVVLFAI